MNTEDLQWSDAPCVSIHSHYLLEFNPVITRCFQKVNLKPFTIRQGFYQFHQQPSQSQYNKGHLLGSNQNKKLPKANQLKKQKGLTMSLLYPKITQRQDQITQGGQNKNLQEKGSTSTLVSTWNQLSHPQNTESLLEEMNRAFRGVQRVESLGKFLTSPEVLK